METKKWWESKINWTAMVGIVAPFVALFGFAPDASFWGLLAAFAIAAQNLLVFVMNTWFSPKVIENSLPKT